MCDGFSRVAIWWHTYATVGGFAAWWRWLANKVPILDVAAPLLKRMAMLAVFLALSRIGNVIFLPGLNLEAVGATLSSGQPLTPVSHTLSLHLAFHR